MGIYIHVCIYIYLISQCQGEEAASGAELETIRLFFCTAEEANSIEWDLPLGSILIHEQMMIIESIQYK